ncbi:class I SAM-dependent methyltransferase [Mangrovimonas spongiae]|uniref:Class I SAM-dependent methyltransferase n=1 Tax=Mangrovimonas spongiae TaxID=2494697 RepID=A0A428K1J4_9FLAO|nr:class I SAM-dependent methyltransferase [Mangrovimonas spongiae]RSK40309.1 class I SAM-dependent methyltransferase [Mangrovimonas spongiae]
MTKNTTQWYASWFDTPYYHILYKDRNYKEAELFMNNLTAYLNLPEQGCILDLACGKGRHSIFLNTLGYNVIGADLSEQSIAYAKQFENGSLKFKVHDMSRPFGQKFDAVFNLFTSFGYFDDDNDNLKTIKAIKENLKPHGFGVIDFMNVNYVLDNLTPESTKTIDGITFNLERFFKDDHLYKSISFHDNGQDFQFEERVKALHLHDFESFFNEAGIYLLDVFGDYNLSKFNPKTSERLIMIFN